MPRNLAPFFRQEIEASATSEVVLEFATIAHPQLEVPIRLVNDPAGFVREDGNLYSPSYFEVTYLTDDERPPRAQVTIHDVAGAIGRELLALKTWVRLKIEELARSDFDNSMPRLPIGTPIVERTADHLRLINVVGDVGTITAQILTFDLTAEPCPGLRATKDNLPGLFR